MALVNIFTGIPSLTAFSITPESGTLVKSTNTTGTLVRPRRSRRKANIPRILLVGATGATCIWIGTLLTTALQGIIPEFIGSKVKLDPVPSPSPSVIVQVSPSPTPTPQPKPPVLSGLLTTDVALETVTQWLSAKTKSFDREYQTAQLKDILVEPALSNAIDRSKAAQGSGIHWEYKHPQIAVASIAQANPQANVATIQAQVEEDAQYYNREKLDPNQSYSKKFLVEYSLIRQQDRWYIKDMAVVQRL